MGGGSGSQADFLCMERLRPRREGQGDLGKEVRAGEGQGGRERTRVPRPGSRGQQHPPTQGTPKPLHPNWPFWGAMPGQWEPPSEALAWQRVVALQSLEADREGCALPGSRVQPLGPPALPFQAQWLLVLRVGVGAAGLARKKGPILSTAGPGERHLLTEGPEH